MRPQVTVASVARNEPAVLNEFLRGIDGLVTPGADISYLLVDDTNDARCTSLLARFAEGRQACTVAPSVLAAEPGAVRPEGRDGDVWRRAALKDFVLSLAAAVPTTTHVLLADSNLVLPPPLLAHLLSLGKDIVSEVYWTEWTAGDGALPSVWQCDEYGFFPSDLARSTAEAKSAAGDAFISQLQRPGTYEVGGLSGCTLVSVAALAAGASFQRLPNLSFWGDDRHFCVRAAALGFSLWADTYLPPLHLYRDDDIGRLLHFWSRWQLNGQAA